MSKTVSKPVSGSKSLATEPSPQTAPATSAATARWKIDHGIPLHPIVTRKPVVVYPVAELKPGDSFYVGLAGRSLATVRQKVRSQALKLKDKGREFAIRKDGDGIRVWRVK